MWAAAVASGGARKGKPFALSPAEGQVDAANKSNNVKPDGRKGASEAAVGCEGNPVPTAEPQVATAADGMWQSSLLRQRVATGASFTNVALSHAALLLRSESARVDAQLIDDFSTILRGNVVYIHNFMCDEKDMQLYNALKGELVAATGAKMLGSGGLLNWSKHQVFDNPSNMSQTFNDIIDMLAEYFDLDVYATRLNYYRDGTQWKPQHHDSHAYGGRALREDFTVGLSLGATRSLLFVHEASQRDFNFPQANGDCFAFTGEVNNLFTHGVPRVHTPTGDRFSIIAWGRRRTLTERNGGVPNSAAAQVQGRHIGTMADAVEVAKQLVAVQPGTTATKKLMLPPSAPGEVSNGSEAAAAPRPVKRHKNRLQ
ncbi:hypothetical protein, conserved [Leishmania tarentolae]|uniref:Fe2OG dioxygenase domain-containing protein n=1 Tax=Leishmania tarentolae TaxID=5689 RepID=A0A640K9M0_LEITA|nr:hypothetical protein, conserved [Leishmania tarentolae]